MVHVERYQPENLRNGRSRGPSPNGHNGSPDTSDDDSTKNAKGNKSGKSKSEYEEKIRVGKDYQTVCPDFIPPQERKLESLNDRALLVWSPTKDIPDIELEKYISVAKEKFGYNGEQALGMLFWHKHDLERAILDLANFTPFPDEWTEEDKVLFEQAFQFHGKSFHRIRQMLPDKSIASLVKHYYSWKKTRSRTSVMDRQEKMKAKEGSENGSENGSNDDSDSEDKKWPLHRGIRRASRSPPPRTSDESSNSVSSSAIKQASPNQNGGSSGNGSNQQTSNISSNSNSKEISSNVIGDNSAAGHSQNATATNVATVSAASATATAATTTAGTNSTNFNTINDKDNFKVTANVSGGGAGGGTSTGTPVGCSSSSNISGSGQNQTKDCGGCGVPCNQTNTSPHGALCRSCFHHWSRTGTLRPTSGPGLSKRSRHNNTSNGVERHKSKLPRGMYINHDDIVTLAKQDSNGRGDDLLTNMEREISTLLTQIQNNKQIASSLKAKNSNRIANIAQLSPGAIATQRVITRWSNDEYQLAIKGMQKHGKDFQAVAEILGTKNESQVSQFYTSNRKKFNLDDIIKEFEAKQQQKQQHQQQQQQQQQQQKMNETQQKMAISSSSSTDTKADIKKHISDDDIMEIDLVEDIPMQDDEDMDDVTIIEPDSMPTTTQKSTTAVTNLVEQLVSIEPMDSISITAISSSSNANGSTHQTQEPVPEVTISPAPGSNSTITSTTSLLAIVEQAKAAAV